MNRKYYELYFDMDGVLYPLNEVVIDQYNRDFNDNFDWRNNTKFNWQDTKGSAEYFVNLLYSEGTFIKGEPYLDILNYINALHNEGYDIKIITVPLWNKYCIYEKIQYLQKYFPWLDPNTDVVATGSKWLCAKENRILIDDSKTNTDSWTLHGGISIPFENNCIIHKGEHYRFNSIKQVYNKIHELEDSYKKRMEV